MQATAFRNWLVQARLAQQIRNISDDEVNSRTDEFIQSQVCSSDDEHVIALAQVSGARLLFTNDRPLQEDFRNPRIINQPRGRIYTTLVNDNVTQVHRNLLATQDHCAWSNCGN